MWIIRVAALDTFVSSRIRWGCEAALIQENQTWKGASHET